MAVHRLLVLLIEVVFFTSLATCCHHFKMWLIFILPTWQHLSEHNFVTQIFQFLKKLIFWLIFLVSTLEQ